MFATALQLLLMAFNPAVVDAVVDAPAVARLLSALKQKNMQPASGAYRSSSSRQGIQDGAHLAVWCPLAQDMGFFHHAMYIGEGLVVHLQRNQGGPRIDLLGTFLEGSDKYFVVNYSPDWYDARAKAIKVAKYYVSNPAELRPYNLVDMNCEYFVTGCKTGNFRSSQIDRINLIVPRPILVAVGELIKFI
jgi:Lecithin retinol acyltransferase